MSNADPIGRGRIPARESQHRTIPAEEATSPSPPLPAERFGLAVGRIMEQFGIAELSVATETGTEVGTLMLSTGSFMGYNMTTVAWHRISESEIQQDIYDMIGKLTTCL